MSSNQAKSSSIFKGTLAEPILIASRQPTVLGSSEENKVAIKQHNYSELMRALCERLEKTEALLEHYGIESESGSSTKFTLLAFKLAEEFVPGFEIKDSTFERKKGRPKKWNWEKQAKLLADVGLLNREKLRSDSEACKVLSSTPRFSGRWGNLKKGTLENQLIKARKAESSPVLILAKLMNDSDEIDKLVTDNILIDVFSITNKDS